MRLSAIFLAVYALGAAGAATAQDRYGPTRAPSTQTAYDAAPTNALAWAGKTYGQPAEAAATRSAPPQPLLNGALRNTSVSPYARLQIAPSVQQPTAHPAAAPAPRPAPPTAIPVANAPVARAPAEQPMAAPAPARIAAQPQIEPTQAQPMQAQPAQRMAEAMPQAAPQSMPMTAPLSSAVFDGAAAPEETASTTSAATRARLAANAANNGGAVSSRYYSVHSAYGMAADPIPLAQTGVGQ